ncbi:transglutaminase domain-containing protein [Candidatus Shapirobacteria bacterium]|nr:transglutaminase domain-containing protein [Candidatus Shapirobacteria bacterium]
MIILFLTILLFGQFRPALATNEFTVNQSILFRVNSDKSASVAQSVTLVNNLSQIYPQDYSLSLTGPVITLTSPQINPDFQITKFNQTGNQSNINLHLVRPGIGKDQSTNFSLNYTIKDFVTTKGKTNEISLPAYQNSLLPASITAAIVVPANLGDLSYSSVPVLSTHNLGDTIEIKLNLSNVSNKILLVFGNHQLVNFKLKYFLKNDSQVITNTEITIPPDTNNQSIYLKDIQPRPKNIKIDPDGNWLAEYQLNSREQIEVNVGGQAKIFPSRQIKTDIDSAKYLTSQTFWPVKDPQITAISTNFTTARQVYNYTVKNLTYDYSQINNSSRKGALFALNNPQNSICTEFSDLFVTLTRNIGIPAREIEGYALSNNQKVKPVNPNSDILHSWAQYYDSTTKTWNSVDPTWENTTNGIDYFTDLDLNHLTFVIHGLSSDYPPPPGAYKSGNDVKTVDVDFATEEIPLISVPPSFTLSQDSIQIYNPNNHSLNHLQVVNKKLNWTESIDTLPPFGKTTVPRPQISFFQNALPTNRSYVFQVSSDELYSTSTTTLQNSSHFLDLTIIIAVSILLLCVGGIMLTTQKK